MVKPPAEVKYNLSVTVVSDDSSNLENVPVKLLSSSRTILTSQNTDMNGLVTFSNLKSDTYYLRINKQEGYEAFEDYIIDLDNNEDVTLTLISE